MQGVLIDKMHKTLDHLQWRRNVFKDDGDKSSYVIKLLGTPFKNRIFSRQKRTL